MKGESARLPLKAVLAALSCCLLFPTNSLSIFPQGSRPENADSAFRSFRRVASLTIETPPGGLGMKLNSSLADLYLVDHKAGKVRHINWKTQEFSEWKELDTGGCSSGDSKISGVRPMSTAPYIIVSGCNHIKLFTNATFSNFQTILADDELKILGFDLSPDERLFVATIRKGREDYTRIYDTNGWKLLSESRFAYSRFTPDSRLLATSAFSTSKPNSVVVDKCGLQFYDAKSGKLISEWIKTVEESGNFCPSFPVFFRTSHPERAVTLSISQTALSEWDAAQGTLIQRMVYAYNQYGPPPGPHSLDASHDGNLFGVVWYRTEPTTEFGLTIWDLCKGNEAAEIPLGPQKDPVLQIAFSSNGSHLAVQHANRIDIYEY